MSEPFLAEITIVGFTFAPRGYALCDGQLLQISQNQSLFSLLGTTYGGDGRTTFALPDLRGRAPIHKGSSGGATHALGAKSGSESETLDEAKMPAHSHTVVASTDNADSNQPLGKVYGRSAEQTYHALGASTDLSNEVIAVTGGGQSHDNMQPYLTLNFCIALQGVFPSRN